MKYSLTEDALRKLICCFKEKLNNHKHSISDVDGVPTKTSELDNDSGFLTSVPSEYVTDSELNTKGYLTSIPSEYVTDSELNSKGYLTEHQDLSDYAKKTDLPTVPTKTSQLTNDSGFLTSIPSEYVTESELSAKKYLTSIPSEYVTDSELSAKGYATQTSVTQLSEEIVDINKDIFDLQMAVGDGGDNSQKWIGQTPFKMTEDASLLSLIGDGEYSFTITSDTVADMDSASEPRGTNCELVKVGKYYELRSTGGAAWYNSYADFVISGLTIGEDYVFYVDGLGRTWDADNHRTCGHYIVCAGSSYSTANNIGTPNENVPATQMGQYQYNIETLKLAFTATTESIVVRAYPSNASYFSSGASVAEFNSFYLNRANTSNKHTGIIDLSGTFTDMRTLADVPAGATITTDPVCDVYAAIVEEDEENAVYMPLKDKTVVCFGDSLFGMYRGVDSAPAFIAESTGATVHNVGFGGCRMSVHPTSGFAAFSMWALAKAIVENNWTTQDAQASSGSAYFPDQLALLKSIDFSTVDYVVIHYGTNDFAAGSAVSIDNANDHDDYNTLCGALRYSIEKLQGKYPKLKIFISLPVFRFWTENNVTTYSDTYLKHGKLLTEFVEALRGTASEYNLPVIDGYYGLGINKVNASAFLSDGTHHNADGRQRFGEYIGANLIAQQTTAKSGVDGSAINTLIENAIGSAIGGAY